MKAARLHAGATSLIVEEVAEPALRPGSAIVRIEAVLATHFAREVIDGSGGYLTPPRPFIPGMDAIATVKAVADDVRGVRVGDRVYCDPHYAPEPLGDPPERVFIGNFARGPQSEALMAAWRDGAYAEFACFPAECLVRIAPDPGVAAAVLCRLGWLGTAYNALVNSGMRPGATVAINGASGVLGASAVVLALALRAARVFAVGRRREALDAVAAIDRRITPATDIAALPALDVVVSSVDGADSTSLDALLLKMGRNGSFVLIGAPKTPMSVPAALLMRSEIVLRGSYWFRRSQIAELLRLAAAGVLDLSVFTPETFPLAAIDRALAAASHRTNPLSHVAVTCG